MLNQKKTTVCCHAPSCMQAPLPQPLTIEAAELQQPDAAAWLGRNLCRVQHLILRGDQAALLPGLNRAAALRSLEVVDCAMLKQLPAGVGELQRLTMLRFNRW